jgi:hypothetical protein
MTLDLIIFRPEFFLLFGFFVLLGYGTGNVVCPVSEYLSIPQISKRNQGSDFLANSANRVHFVENLSRNPDGK